MPSLQNGDIVLVRFPFTSLKASKLRPAVIISTERVHKKTNDYTLMFISSMIPTRCSPYEMLFSEDHVDFKTSGLKKNSVFKAHKIVTIERELLKRRLGKLGPVIRGDLAGVFAQAISI
jgi:mRNA interferase MazF